MSTAVITELRNVLTVHGVPAAAPVYEPMICDQNYYCDGDKNSDEALTEALTKEVQQLQAAQQVVLLKTHLSGSYPQYIQALKSFGAVAVEVYRSNRLNAYLCKVKDCMEMEQEVQLASYLVDPYDRGKRVPCSISRRYKNTTEQPLVHV